MLTNIQVEMLLEFAHKAYECKKRLEEQASHLTLEEMDELEELCETNLHFIAIIVRFVFNQPFFFIAPDSKLIQEEPTPENVWDWFMNLPLRTNPKWSLSRRRSRSQ